jgi:type I restriction enzyme S subunit
MKKPIIDMFFIGVSFNYENIKNMGQGARGDLNSSMIKNFKIPIPPLSEQTRIVSILDKFDTLTTSISEGLLRR